MEGAECDWSGGSPRESKGVGGTEARLAIVRGMKGERGEEVCSEG